MDLVQLALLLALGVALTLPWWQRWHLRILGVRDVNRFMFLNSQRFEKAVEGQGETILYRYRPVGGWKQGCLGTLSTIILVIMILPSMLAVAAQDPEWPYFAAGSLGMTLLFAYAQFLVSRRSLTCVVITDRGVHWTNFKTSPEWRFLPPDRIRKLKAACRYGFCSGSLHGDDGSCITLQTLSEIKGLLAACESLGIHRTVFGMKI